MTFGEGQRQCTPVLLPGKSHGWRSLVGCSPWGLWELDTTERLHFNFSLSCTGEGNGNPLQYSCLENPRNGGTRWTAVYGVAQSRTRLKRQQQQQQFTYHIIHIFKVYNPMFYWIFIKLCNQIQSILEHIHHPKMKHSTNEQSLPISPCNSLGIGWH